MQEQRIFTLTNIEVYFTTKASVTKNMQAGFSNNACIIIYLQLKHSYKCSISRTPKLT